MIVLKPFNGRTRRFTAGMQVAHEDSADWPFPFEKARELGLIGEKAAAAPAAEQTEPAETKSRRSR
jgi:hypothetical protein